MAYSSLYLSMGLAFLSITAALPLEGSKTQRANIVPRAMSYSIVNVDGGSTAPPDATTTLVVTQTRTDSIGAPSSVPAITVTDIVTATVVAPTSTSAYSSRSTSSTGLATQSSTAVATSLSSSSARTLQPQPISSKASSVTRPSVVTIIVTASDAASTEYYDDGMWHTHYRVKTAANLVIPTPSVSTSNTILTSTSTSVSSLVTTAPFPTLLSTTIQGYNHTQVPA